ncbi:MAG: TIGR02281 family clan AA aspartic protease [bacterium]|nr:TIGR02281 family clan AA aspartic protease [bacterium]
MKRLIPLLAVVVLASGAAFPTSSAAQQPCQAVDELNLLDPNRPGRRFTTPPYVAVTASGGLKRLARRSRPLRQPTALSPDQVSCLGALTGVSMTAVRGGSSYRYKLQTPGGTLLIFHVADLEGSEAVVPTQAERLLATAERFLKEGNRAEAARAYGAVLEAGPRPVETAEAQTALGRMENEGGRAYVALHHFRKAVEAYPRFPPALEEHAALSMALGQPEEARRSYMALTTLVPNRSGPYVALVRLAQQRDDREEANRLFRMLQAVDPNAAARLAYEIPSLKSLKTERQHAPTVTDEFEIPLGSRPGGTLTVNVSVNGSEPMTFIVDTGASLVTLKEATARRLGIEIDPKLKARFQTANGIRIGFLITIDRMEIEGIEAKGVKGSILDEDFGGNMEGLLGQSFLRKINARIDIEKKVMVIEQRQ